MPDSWLTKLRIKYWDIKNDGKRYAELRKAKNRQAEYAGKYLIKEVSKRTGILSSVIERIERGSVDGMAQIQPLLKDLDISEQDFYRMGPAGAQVEQSLPKVTTSSTNEVPTKTEAKTKIPVAPKNRQLEARSMEVINCSTESLFVKIVDEKIYLFPNSSEYARKGTFVGGADEIAGMPPRPRTTIVKIDI